MNQGGGLLGLSPAIRGSKASFKGSDLSLNLRNNSAQFLDMAYKKRALFAGKKQDSNEKDAD